MAPSRFKGAICCAVMALLAMAPQAMARDAYVTNSGDGTVSVLNLATNASTGTVTVGAKPVDVAITPNGKFAYVANETDGTVSVILVASRSVVTTITVGKAPRGVAISPDGRTVWVTDSGDNDVRTIDTATNAVSGPISVGNEPEGIAISPDGLHAFIAQKGGNVSIVDTATRAVVADFVDDNRGPSRIAIGPRGGRAFVTDSGFNTVTAFNPDNGAAGTPIPVGAQPSAIAIDPSGALAYAVAGDGTMTPITTSNNVPGTQVTGLSSPLGIAIAPSGSAGYVTNGVVTGFNTASNGFFGPLTAGATPAGIAIVPDQGPTAALFVTPAVRMVNRNVAFDAGASRDPDGKIASYAFNFGDGRTVKGTKAKRWHAYKKPGTYAATLTVTDDEGCSTDLIFTGQTASCNGSAVASVTATVVVADDRGPALNLAGGRRQRLGRRVSVFARCPREACGTRVAGTVALLTRRGRGSRRHVVRGNRRLRPVGARLAAGVWRRFDLRVSPGPRRLIARALRSGGRATARLTVTAVDSTGLKTTHRRNVRLFGPHPRRRRGGRS